MIAEIEGPGGADVVGEYIVFEFSRDRVCDRWLSVRLPLFSET
jgi:hypothetical protein